MKKKNLIDSFLPFAVLSVIYFLSNSFITSHLGMVIGEIVGLAIVYIPFIALEHFKFQHRPYALFSALSYIILIVMALLFDLYFYTAKIPYVIAYSVCNTVLILYFTHQGNQNLYARKFNQLLGMKLEGLKELFGQDWIEYQNDFLNELTHINDLKSCKLDSYDQQFSIVKVTHFPSMDWTVLFIDSNFRKSIVAIARNEKKLGMYSVPIETNYKLDTLLYKALEKLKQ